MPARTENRLIQGLPRTLGRRLLNGCESICLVEGNSLFGADEPFQYVYFPILAFVSMGTTLGDHAPLEMGLVGNEGMLGATLALGVNTGPVHAVVRGSGAALRMPREQFQDELRLSPVLNRAVGLYLSVIMSQLIQSAACMHFHEVGPRLARWLLMIHDRAHTDQFAITHELLANMLGARRSGVTIAAGQLQDRKLISYRRGRISVVNRKGLEASACECYEATIGYYDRLLA
jgi:CRP-like cAMP-binding protein